MRRIGLAVVLTVGLVLPPLAAVAQQAGKVWRLGILDPGVAVSDAAWARSPLAEHLRHLGYVESRNLAVERRYAGARIDLLPKLAAELLQLKVDILLTVSTPGVEAAMKATETTPIVFVGVADPVETGLVKSLARPGGNVTGVSTQLTDLVGKQLQLLRELVPGLSHLAVLWNSGNPASARGLTSMEQLARPLRIRITALAVRDVPELEAAFTALTRERPPDALFVHPTAPMFDYRERIMVFALTRQIVVLSASRLMAEAGALASYGPDNKERDRLAAEYVDKILRGTKPRDLPIQQPTKFEFVINLKTARAIGLTIPQSVLGRADQVIE